MADNSQTRTGRRQAKKSKKRPLWKKIMLAFLLIILAAGLGAGAVGIYWIATAPDLDAAQLSDPLSSVVLDQNEEVVTTLAGEEDRTRVSYEDLPEVLIDAVVATEDARFFEHSGIDLRRIGGAILANISRGFGAEGASTITQQVVENAFLSPDQKLSIKVQEQWLALQLERQYTKEEIMEMYLNKIFYGNRAYGVARAAESYFGKDDLHDLTLQEAAILAGLPQRPSAYNPYNNPELTEQRMNTVLDLMVRHEKITEEEADEAREVDIPSLLSDATPDDSTPYPGFIQQVQREVESKVDGADIYTDGLRIYTTLDTDVQEHVEFLLSDSEENPIPYPDDEMQAGMVVLDTENGAIRAVGGKRNQQGDEYNNAIQGGQQPGSILKPFTSYGPAIEYDQISTYHQINDDKPYEVEGSSPIRNWNRSYAGWVTARYALNQSLNVPAVKVMEEVGRERAQPFAESLGINFHEDYLDVRDVIGGRETVVTPLQMAGAYRGFANEGIYNEPYAVTKVEFPDGRTVELKPEPEAVMSDYTAYMITDMLKSVISEGTGTEANVPGMPVAGKTGTTSLPDETGSPDSWFVGYSTNYTISAWTGGYEDRAPIPQGHTRVPHALFKNTMEEISRDMDTPDFVQPDSVVEVQVEKGSNPAALPSDYTPASEIVTELFVRGTEPSSTSERFDELEPVSGLSAEYNEDANTIEVQWDYDGDADVSFDVSYSIDGGEMQSLSSTGDTSIEISEVESGADYEIQVIAVSNDNDMESEPRTTSVRVPDEDEDEEEQEENGDEEENEEDNGGNIPPVSSLRAEYDEARAIIDVTWSYNGPPASFEVDVNGQTQTVESNGIEISGATPGENYTINVTPIGQEGANEGVRGETQSTSVSVPDNEDEEDDEDEENPDDENDNDDDG